MGKFKRERLGVLLRDADNVVPLRNGKALLRGGEPPHRETLLEENARLRKLAVQLSNLLGDLPPFEM
jgi:hypothetical protein